MKDGKDEVRLDGDLTRVGSVRSASDRRVDVSDVLRTFPHFAEITPLTHDPSKCARVKL